MIEHKLLLLKLGQIRLYINVIQFRPKISQDSSEGDIWMVKFNDFSVSAYTLDDFYNSCIYLLPTRQILSKFMFITIWKYVNVSFTFLMFLIVF